MIDLCIDARMAFCSGIGTYIREIIPRLKGAFRISLLVDQLEHQWCKDFEQILFKAPIYSAQEQLQFPFVIPPCDLFWSPHYNVPLLPIRAKKRIVTIHDVCHLQYGSFKQKVYAHVMLRRALKSDRIITISAFSKKEIERFFGKRPIDVIPIGVNLDHFYSREPSEEIRLKYNLPSKYALFVGSQKIHKNLEGCKRAVEKVGLTLVAAGKGLQEIEMGDLPSVYSMAEVLVFPSFYEGFGLPPLEAMACGCPTAVSRVASIPEVCADASVYFDPYDLEDMARAIQLARKKELVENGLQRTRLFSWDKCVQNYKDLLNSDRFG